MATSVGAAYIQVYPSLDQFQTRLNAGINGPVTAAGATASTSFGSKFTSGLGRAAKVGGAVLGGAAAYGAVSFAKNAVGLEAEFGKTMNLLAATTGAPKRDMQSLSDLALKMGQDTVFSASDASEAMLELARGGMKAATIEGGALKGTLTLAAAGQLSMAEAAAVTNKSMGQFNLTGKDAGSIAAALAGAANASSASVGDLSQALSQGGLAANSVGFSIQETTGVLAAFSNAGLEGSDAGTSMKTMLDRLQPTTAASSKAFRELGITTDDNANRFIKANGEYKSAAQISEILKRGTEDLTASERKRAITQAFGSDAQRAATILSQEGASGIRDMTKATSDQGAAQKTAQASMKGTAGAIEQMRGSIETASLAFGMAIKPLTIFGAGLVTEIANRAVPLFEHFGGVIRDFFKNGPSFTELGRTIGQAFRGIDWTSVTGGLGSIGDSLRSADWSGFKTAFGQGASDTLSVFSVVIKFLADHVDTLARHMPVLIAAFIAYKASLAVDLPLMAAHIGSNIALSFSQRALATQMAITNGVEKTGMITRARTTVVTIAKTVAEKAAAAASKAMAAATWLVNAAMRANPIGIVITALTLLAGAFYVAYRKSSTFREIVNGAWDAIKRGASAAWDGIKQVFGWLVDGLRSVGDKWGDFKQAVADAWTGIKTNVSNAADAVKRTITGAWDSIKTGVDNAWDAVKGKISDAWNGIKTVVGNAAGAVQDELAQRWANIKTNVSNTWDGIKTVLSNAWGWVKTQLGNYVDVWKSILSKGWDLIKSVVSNTWDAIKNTVSNAWDFLGRVFGAMKDGLRLVGNVFDGFQDTVGDVFDGAQDIVRGAVAWIVDKFLWMAESIVGAAASAFSWVPGIGDKLAGAEQSIADFRAKVNAELAAIDDEAVHINVVTSQTRIDKVAAQLGPPGASGGAGKLPAVGGGLTFKTSTPVANVHNIAGDAQDLAHDTARMLGKKLSDLVPPNILGQAGRVLPRGAYSIGMPWMGYPGHYGADYPAATGTPVWSPWAGKVTTSADIPGQSDYNNLGYTSYGRYVKVDHGNGLSSLFAHMFRRMVAAGQTLRAGQQVGEVGEMGNATGPHLHYEASRNGQRFDPARLGIFDKGGWLKDFGVNLSGKPEAVLSPNESAAFKQLARAATTSVQRSPASQHAVAASAGSGGDRVRAEFDFGGGRTLTGWITEVTDDRIGAHNRLDARVGRP